MFSEKYRQTIHKAFADCMKDEKTGSLENREKIMTFVQTQDAGQKEALEFLYASMPQSDIADYDPEIFADYARHGEKLWKENIWNVDMPDEIFANYVLHYRVNNEDIVPCREFFYDKLKDLIKGKTMMEAIIAINYWCAAMATYQTTDERTASAMTVYRSAYGRCGEESTFAVTAYRSVGIPARQIYAPLWSHCDDNHAWVEVWADGQWHFLGACEPDEILDTGWFTTPSSRAMMLHSRWLGCDKPQESIVGTKGMAKVLNHLNRYANTKFFTVHVKDEEGKAVPHARVRCSVANYGMLGEITVIQTDETGSITMETGLGSVFLSCRDGELYGEKLVDVRECAEAELMIKKEFFQFDTWVDMENIAPAAAAIHTGEATEEQAARCKEYTEQCAQHRNGRIENFFDEKESQEALRLCPDPENGRRILQESRGNFGEIVRFLRWNEEDAILWKWKMALLLNLTNKDYRDLRAEVLIHHMEEVLPYAEELLAAGVSEEVFVESVLRVRVSLERLTPYAGFIKGFFTEEQKEQFRKNSEALLKYIEKHIATNPDREYGNLITTPEGCLRNGTGSKLSCDVLFVAVCRSIGVPARLNPVNGQPEIYRDGAYVNVRRAPEEKAAWIRVCPDEKTAWSYYQNWTVSCFDGKQFLPLEPTEENLKENLIPAVPGIYRAFTVNRLPDGSVLSRKMDFELKEGEERCISLSLQERKLVDILERVQLNGIVLKDGDGAEHTLESLKAPKSGKIVLWLEESREPTEHILNEIHDALEQFRPLQKQLYFVLRSKEALKDPRISRGLSELPEINVLYDDFTANKEKLGQVLTIDLNKLPVILAVKEENICVYSTSGYNVGTADMLLRIMNMEQEEKA